MGVKLWGMIRFMDDVRTTLQPFRPGWRWEGDRIRYCGRWEKEDIGLTGTERTMRILAGAMGTMENFLQFTTETGGGFQRWLAPNPGYVLKSLRGQQSSVQVLGEAYERQ